VSSYDGRMRYAPGLQLDMCAPKEEKPPEVRHIGTVDLVLCEQFDRDVGDLPSGASAKMKSSVVEIGL